jgi:hypothetical protein
MLLVLDAVTMQERARFKESPKYLSLEVKSVEGIKGLA